jgi:hypothetical protein
VCTTCLSKGIETIISNGIDEEIGDKLMKKKEQHEEQLEEVSESLAAQPPPANPS